MKSGCFLKNSEKNEKLKPPTVMEGSGGFCSPRLLAVKTHKHSKNQGQERGAKNQIRRFLFFLFWVLKKKEKKKPCCNPNVSTSLPNSEEEAGLARKRRGGGGGKNYFLSLPPQPLWHRPADCENITLREGRRRLPIKKPRRVTGRREGGRGGGRKAQEAEKIRSECPAF